MSWRQCAKCGWWQKQRGACIGCAHASSSSYFASLHLDAKLSRLQNERLQLTSPVSTSSGSLPKNRRSTSMSKWSICAVNASDGVSVPGPPAGSAPPVCQTHSLSYQDSGHPWERPGPWLRNTTVQPRKSLHERHLPQNSLDLCRTTRP